MTTEYDPFAEFDKRESREDVDRKKLIASAQQAEDVQWLMGDARGRRLMWSWLEFCGVRRTPFAGNNDQTNFKAGVHNVGLMLEANIMEHAPEAWLQMVNEAREPKS